MIVSVSGPAHAGKTTMARMLGLPVRSFASKLRDVCRQLGFSAEDLSVNKDVEFDEVRTVGLDVIGECGFLSYLPEPLSVTSGRDLLQQVGSAFRKVDPDYWVSHVFEEPGSFCIDDCRYPNERAAVRKRGGFLIRLVRSETKNDLGNLGDHPSETSLGDYSEYDLVIVNTDGLDELERSAKTVLLMLEKLGQVRELPN